MALILQEDFFGVPQVLEKTKRKSKKAAAAEDVVSSVSDELDAIKFGKGAEIITVTKDVSNLSETDKLGMLLNIVINSVCCYYATLLCVCCSLSCLQITRVLYWVCLLDVHQSFCVYIQMILYVIDFKLNSFVYASLPYMQK